jgi:hypothetical protein
MEKEYRKRYKKSSFKKIRLSASSAYFCLIPGLVVLLGLFFACGGLKRFKKY